MGSIFDTTNERIAIIDSSGVDSITFLTCWVVYNEEADQSQVQYPKSFTLELDGNIKEYFIYRYNHKLDVMMYKEQ